MEQEIIEGNKLIAEFMGWQKTKHGNYWFPNLYPSAEDSGETTFGIESAIFHTSWDWLMPVVKKVSDIINPVNWDRIVEALADVDINKCFDEIVKSIKWYNQNKK